MCLCVRGAFRANVYKDTRPKALGFPWGLLPKKTVTLNESFEGCSCCSLFASMVTYGGARIWKLGQMVPLAFISSDRSNSLNFQIESLWFHQWRLWWEVAQLGWWCLLHQWVGGGAFLTGWCWNFYSVSLFWYDPQMNTRSDTFLDAMSIDKVKNPTALFWWKQSGNSCRWRCSFLRTNSSL